MLNWKCSCYGVKWQVCTYCIVLSLQIFFPSILRHCIDLHHNYILQAFVLRMVICTSYFCTNYFPFLKAKIGFEIGLLLRPWSLHFVLKYLMLFLAIGAFCTRITQPGVGGIKLCLWHYNILLQDFEVMILILQKHTMEIWTHFVENVWLISFGDYVFKTGKYCLDPKYVSWTNVYISFYTIKGVYWEMCVTTL